MIVETPLPPKSLRMGGRNFATDRAFVRGALGDVEKLRDLTGLNRSSRVLDFGCGAGRLAVGIAESLGRVGLYRGVDVQPALIEWAQRHLAGPGFEFVHGDAANERYNPDGGGFTPLPGDDADFDLVYAYSVFSHMRGDDVAGYLAEFARVLRPEGFAYLTAFVEDGVRPESVNPHGYRRLVWLGKLHCVRYSRERFEALAAAAGFEVVHRDHAAETDGQTLYVLTRAPLRRRST